MAHRSFVLSPIRPAGDDRRRAALRSVLRVTYHYGVIGTVGYLLVGALAGHDVDLVFVGALAALYGTALGRGLRRAHAVCSTTDTLPSVTDQEVRDGA